MTVETRLLDEVRVPNRYAARDHGADERVIVTCSARSIGHNGDPGRHARQGRDSPAYGTQTLGTESTEASGHVADSARLGRMRTLGVCLHVRLHRVTRGAAHAPLNRGTAREDHNEDRPHGERERERQAPTRSR